MRNFYLFIFGATPSSTKGSLLVLRSRVIYRKRNSAKEDVYFKIIHTLWVSPPPTSFIPPECSEPPTPGMRRKGSLL